MFLFLDHPRTARDLHGFPISSWILRRTLNQIPCGFDACGFPFTNSQSQTKKNPDSCANTLLKLLLGLVLGRGLPLSFHDVGRCPFLLYNYVSTLCHTNYTEPPIVEPVSAMLWRSRPVKLEAAATSRFQSRFCSNILDGPQACLPECIFQLQQSPRAAPHEQNNGGSTFKKLCTSGPCNKEYATSSDQSRKLATPNRTLRSSVRQSSQVGVPELSCLQWPPYQLPMSLAPFAVTSWICTASFISFLLPTRLPFTLQPGRLQLHSLRSHTCDHKDCFPRPAKNPAVVPDRCSLRHGNKGRLSNKSQKLS